MLFLPGPRHELINTSFPHLAPIHCRYHICWKQLAIPVLIDYVQFISLPSRNWQLAKVSFLWQHALNSQLNPLLIWATNNMSYHPLHVWYVPDTVRHKVPVYVLVSLQKYQRRRGKLESDLYYNFRHFSLVTLRLNKWPPSASYSATTALTSLNSDKSTRLSSLLTSIKGRPLSYSPLNSQHLEHPQNTVGVQ